MAGLAWTTLVSLTSEEGEIRHQTKLGLELVIDLGEGEGGRGIGFIVIKTIPEE